MQTDKIKVTVQVLNGATGDIREVVAKVQAADEQDAVNKLMANARRDDYYYRFLGSHGVLSPVAFDDKLEHEGMTYFARY